MNKAAWFLTLNKAETPEGPEWIIGINTQQSTLFFFNKNKLNKNIEAEITRKIRTI